MELLILLYLGPVSPLGAPLGKALTLCAPLYPHLPPHHGLNPLPLSLNPPLLPLTPLWSLLPLQVLYFFLFLLFFYSLFFLFVFCLFHIMALVSFCFNFLVLLWIKLLLILDIIFELITFDFYLL